MDCSVSSANRRRLGVANLYINRYIPIPLVENLTQSHACVHVCISGSDKKKLKIKNYMQSRKHLPIAVVYFPACARCLVYTSLPCRCCFVHEVLPCPHLLSSAHSVTGSCHHGQHHQDTSSSNSARAERRAALVALRQDRATALIPGRFHPAASAD